MLMFLEATYPNYLDMIRDGHYVPTKIVHIRIPILKKTEYSIRRINILMFLEATYHNYLDRICDGVPTQIVHTQVVEGQTILEHYVIKEKKYWTPKEKNEVLKDAKVRNILHYSLDTLMSNMVIVYKTAKEI